MVEIVQEGSTLLNNAQIPCTVLKAMPKIELHRHLEGSLRLETLLEIAREHELDLPKDNAEQLRPYVQITDDPQDHEVFLGKFEVLRHFYRSPETISRLVYEAVADAAQDNIQYMELRFSPQAQARIRGFPLSEVTDWVIAAAQSASHDYNIHVGLIVTLLRHEPVDQARHVAEIAFDRVNKGIVGLDLAGDEVKYDAQPFQPLFKEAKEQGLGITVHAGEWASANGVGQAIEALYADRIGHGIRTIEDSRILRLVQERNVALEVCLTSNLQTGVIHKISHHPFMDLFDLGVPVTINTDDPTVSNLTLTDEFEVATAVLGMQYDELSKCILNAAEAAFLPEQERQQLVASFVQQLSELEPPDA